LRPAPRGGREGRTSGIRLIVQSFGSVVLEWDRLFIVATL
jgi:hypothetical protein